MQFFVFRADFCGFCEWGAAFYYKTGSAGVDVSIFFIIFVVYFTEKKMKHGLLRFIYVMILAATAAGAVAAPIDEAKQLYAAGDYTAAIDQLQTLLKKSPRDGTVNYYLGASLMAVGRKTEALGPLRQAQSRGVADASRLLADYAISRYDVDEAEEQLDKWAEQLKKNRKPVPEEHAEMSSRVVQLSNMMDRVEKIEVIDSISCDSATFFEAYRLSKEAGRILPGDAVRRIGAGVDARSLSVAYLPESRTEVLWAQSGDDGKYQLYGADILDDGSISHPAPLSDQLGQGGNAQFPFLMPDGVTLYFANDGENSLGGYDIFMTRRTEGDDGSEYFQPQNVGMPYNSPANDYMLAIDEASGLGWWATDRNAEPGKVTVYVFIPSEVRVNAAPDDPNLHELARLSDMSLTRKEGVDYSELLQSRLPEPDEGDSGSSSSPRFALDAGNGKVYTSLSDFHNDRARSAMLEALGVEAELRKHLAREEALRERWRKGDRGVRLDILDSETQTAQLRERIANLRNTAARLENPANK